MHNNTAEPRDEIMTEHFDPSHTSIQQAVAHIAAVHPTACAVEHGKQQLSYVDLNERAGLLAAHLRSKGVMPGELVGVAVNRSPEQVIAVLAIIRAGGAVLPLDTSYPSERLEFMTSDSGIRHLVTSDQALKNVHIGYLRQLNIIDVNSPQARFEGLCAVTERTSPEAAVYCIYTSGSTGQPKCVVVPHRAIENIVTWHQTRWLIGLGLRTLLYSPISFDVAFHELFLGLCTGATLVQVDEDVRRNPLAVVDFLRTERIEKCYLPYTALQQIAESARTLPPPEHLREIIIGGERLQITPAIRDFARATGCSMHNQYGSTECIDITSHTLSGQPAQWPNIAPIGRCDIANMKAYLLDDSLQEVAPGDIGEIYAEGDCLAQGYHRRPQLTALRFVASPFTAGRRLYRTGDLARSNVDGVLDFLGRSDAQIKIRGHRVEPEEVEAVLTNHPGVSECVVGSSSRTHGGDILVANVVASSDVDIETLPGVLRAYLTQLVPDYMVPPRVVVVDALPLTTSGKVDRRALISKSTPESNKPSSSSNSVAAVVQRIWQELLEQPAVDFDETFTDLGADSLMLVRAHQRLSATLDRTLPADLLIRHYTARRLIDHLDENLPNGGGISPPCESVSHSTDRSDRAIAIVGMACRVPGADDIDQFWANLIRGVESITPLAPTHVFKLPVDQTKDDHFVPVAASITDIEMFDANFFGYSPAEAEIIDPQQRLFLELAWHALEDSGTSTGRYRVGVFAGASLSTYLVNNVLPVKLQSGLFLSHRQFRNAADVRIEQGNAPDHLPTRVSYKLGLRGPSVNIQSTCSTSLLAVHLARQSILAGDCDVALAGGVSVISPQDTGYLWRPGMMVSRDGHCRTFDAAANGTVFGNGLGIVVLKRLRDAIADQDRIYAVIAGGAANNDGSDKGDYAGPNIDAQAAVITAAHQDAGITGGDVSYIEAHGTATVLGDPIEIQGLTQAFGATEPGGANFCAIGSVKTNVGHLDEAAGVIGLIKTALSIFHAQIPASLHFREPNPLCAIDKTPFYVNTQLRDWPDCPDGVRRAGVSSFGMGGTNCHIVVEQAPSETLKPNASSVDTTPHPLTLSARSPEALRETVTRYHQYLSCYRGGFGDLCFSAATAPRHFEYRNSIVATNATEAIDRLQELLTDRAHNPCSPPHRPPKIAFLCTGTGAHYPAMGQELYESQPAFRDALDHCDALLKPKMGQSLTEALYAAGNAGTLVPDRLTHVHPATFSIGYATAQLWNSWGISPDVLIGHSLGEYLVACLAGILSLDDALGLVCARARLVEELAPIGGMVQVAADAATVASAIESIRGQVCIAAINSPEGTLISGDPGALEVAVTEFTRQGVDTFRIPVSHAFHSPSMACVLEAYRAETQAVTYSNAQIPIIANLSGKRATADDLSSPQYWQRHMLEAVQFIGTMATADELGVDAFVEIGPKATLLGLGRRCLPDSSALWLPSLSPRDPNAAVTSLSDLYTRGVDVDWRGYYAPSSHKRVSLPRYPFERQRHWIDAPPSRHQTIRDDKGAAQRQTRSLDNSTGVSVLQLEYEPAPNPSPPDCATRQFVVLGESTSLSRRITAELAGMHIAVDFAAGPTGAHVSIDLHQAGQTRPISGLIIAPCRQNPDRCAATLLEILDTTRVALDALSTSSPTTDLWFLTEDEDLIGGPLAAFARTLAAEHPDMNCTAIVIPTDADDDDIRTIGTCLCSGSQYSGEQLALRSGRLWRARLALKSTTDNAAPLPVRSDGTYLITGGTGALGLHVATAIATRRPQRIVLTSRHGSPANIEAWQRLVTTGSCVDVVKADVTNDADIRRVINDIGPGLRGVIHCAGVVDDGIFVKQSRSRISDVLAPKIVGAWSLHKATLHADLDFFISYSSLSSVVAYRGQASYAVANAFLDELARHRRQLGLPALSVSWGSWEGDGMTATLKSAQQDHLRANGETPLTPDRALAALNTLVDDATPHAAVVQMNWPRFGDSLNHCAPVLNRLTFQQSPNEPEPRHRPMQPPFAVRLRQASPSEAVALVHAAIADIVAGLLGVESQQLDNTRGFGDMGLDSVGALDLKAHIQRDLGAVIPTTAVFQYPTVPALASHLATAYFANDIAEDNQMTVYHNDTDALTHPSRPLPLPQNTSRDVAIIGMACRFPGAQSPEALWELLLSGRDVVRPIPASRWDIDAFYDPDPQTPDKMHVKHACTLEDIEGFDARFFGISPREATAMDPRHRLMLEVAWNALEAAAVDPVSLRGSNCGVYLGCDEFLNDYLRSAEPRLGSDPYLATGNTLSMTAGRLSYKLGCHGPSMVVATGCSSSLAAVHTAAQAVRTGECELALVGSGKLLIDPYETIQLCKLGALSPDGRSKVFADNANGFGRGEGIAAIVLKRLDHAERDGDPIQAIIRGSAINHDGPSSGLTVPNPAAQTTVVEQALRNAGITPECVGYVEAHGAGTSLGDPIEIDALGAAFKDRSRPVYVGSVKANIGHLEEAAGMAGLIKTVLVLQNGKIPAQPHCHPRNRHIDWDRLPIEVPQTVIPWPDREHRIAAISSIGLSGTNAHVVLEAHTPSDNRRHRGAFIFPFSAHDIDDLDHGLSQIADALHGDLDPAQVAFTLQTGRTHYHQRVAVIAHSIEELRTGISTLRSDSTPVGSDTQGGSPTSPIVSFATADAGHNLDQADLSGLAQRWCNGHAVEWTLLYQGSLPRRLSLPGYAFKRSTITPPPDTTQDQMAPHPKDDEMSRALPQPHHTDEDDLHSFVAELLGYAPEDLDRAANLERLGADSLIFTRLAHHLRDCYHIEVSFHELIEEITTVTDIINAVGQKQPPTGPPANIAATDTRRSSITTTTDTPRAPEVPSADQNGLTTTQRNFVDSLISEITASTAGSKLRAARDITVMANCRMTTFNAELKEITYPIVAARAHGARFWDVDDNEYIDISMGYGVHLLGYQPDAVVDALQQQLADGVYIGPQAANAGDVAKKLCALTGMQRAAFCNTGTEGVMSALRFARTVTGRTQFVMFEGSYHGWSDGTLALPAGTVKSIPIARGIGSGAMSDVIVLEYGAPESLQIIKEVGPHLAAVLVEPVQSRRPDLQPLAFLHELREITRDCGAALIFDEVVTGFRIGPRGAQGWSEIDADLAIYGKILGGGMPIGAVAGSAAFLDTVDGGAWSYGDDSQPQAPTTFFGGTFNKNPMTMAAAAAVLDELADRGPSLQQAVADNVARLADTFNSFCASHGFPVKIVHFSSIFRFIVDGDYRLERVPLAVELFYHLLAHRGIYVLETRVCFLSATHTAEDVKIIADTAQSCLTTLREAGFFPTEPRTTRQPKPAGDAYLDYHLPLRHQRHAQPSGTVILTGATGFLGRYLAKGLLEHTQSQIYCLVRADDDAHAQLRIAAALEEIDVPDELTRSRIVAIASDLTAPQFAIEDKRWAQLTREAGSIYHCAAQVNSLLPYSRLRAANVDATRQLLRLAATGSLSTFHYVSSDAVFDAYGYHRHASIYEDQPLAYYDSIYGGGYAQSKWISDTMVDLAGKDGLPISIYRPGALLPITRPDNSQPEDFLTRFLLGVIKLGVCPELDATIDLTSVDYAAGLIVELSRLGETGHFHLTHPRPIPYQEFIEVLNSEGHAVKIVPLHEWETIIRAVRFADNNPLYPLLPLFTDSPDPYFRRARLDVSRTRAAIPDSDNRCPPVSELVTKYLRRLVHGGRLESSQ